MVAPTGIEPEPGRPFGPIESYLADSAWMQIGLFGLMTSTEAYGVINVLSKPSFEGRFFDLK